MLPSGEPARGSRGALTGFGRVESLRESRAEAPALIELTCTVRGCGARLARAGGEMRCPSGHAFDVARSGYVNLLQPQDRRATAAGDSPLAVTARRRWLGRGFGASLLASLDEAVRAAAVPDRAAVIDVGCGDGYFLAGLAARRSWGACGIDLSPSAAAAAARRAPAHQWVVANADRRLPIADRSVDLILSIFGRRNGAEFHRVGRDATTLILALPAEDDLVELREAVLGPARGFDRVGTVLEEMGAGFELIDRRVSRTFLRLDAEGVADALAMTYRGARHERSARAARIESLEVTSSADLLTLRWT